MRPLQLDEIVSTEAAPPYGQPRFARAQVQISSNERPVVALKPSGEFGYLTNWEDMVRRSYPGPVEVGASPCQLCQLRFFALRLATYRGALGPWGTGGGEGPAPRGPWPPTQPR